MGHCETEFIYFLCQFISCQLVKNYINIKRVTIVTFHILIFSKIQFGDEIKYVSFTTYIVTFHGKT